MIREASERNGWLPFADAPHLLIKMTYYLFLFFLLLFSWASYVITRCNSINFLTIMHLLLHLINITLFEWWWHLYFAAHLTLPLFSYRLVHLFDLVWDKRVLQGRREVVLYWVLCGYVAYWDLFHLMMVYYGSMGLPSFDATCQMSMVITRLLTQFGFILMIWILMILWFEGIFETTPPHDRLALIFTFYNTLSFCTFAILLRWNYVIRVTGATRFLWSHFLFTFFHLVFWGVVRLRVAQLGVRGEDPGFVGVVNHALNTFCVTIYFLWFLFGYFQLFIFPPKRGQHRIFGSWLSLPYRSCSRYIFSHSRIGIPFSYRTSLLYSISTVMITLVILFIIR